MTTYNPEHMQKAIELSTRGMEQGDGGPFGAVVVQDDTVIAEGWNQVLVSNDPTAHAEITAIRAACRQLGRFDLSDCEIYTSCEPCPMCLGAIYWARPQAVYYANTKAQAAEIEFDDSFIYGEIAKLDNERSIKFYHRPSEQALAAFKAWQAKTDKTQY